MKFISLKSIHLFYNLNIDQLEAEEYATQALNMLHIPGVYERKVCIEKLSSHKITMPKDLKSIELVVYVPNLSSIEKTVKTVISTSNETTTDYNGLYKTVTETNTKMTTSPASKDYNEETISRIQHQGVLNNYKLWVEQPNLEGLLLTYKRTKDTASMLCDYCPNLDTGCKEYFYYTPQNIIITSLKEGYICLYYLAYARDEQNKILIPDDDDLKRTLATYIQMRYWESRLVYHEDNAYRLYERYLVAWEKLSMKVRGNSILRSVTPDTIDQNSNRLMGFLKQDKVFNNY